MPYARFPEMCRVQSARRLHAILASTYRLQPRHYWWRQAVGDKTDSNWASGIADPVFKLSEGGASDDELLDFIGAWRIGDLERARGILSRPRKPAIKKESDLGQTLDDVLLRLRV